MSNLLEQASLVMIPSGYKEDVVYSVIPTSGAGDLTFTRASNGTRIDSNGNVEVVPWNLVEYSEQFDNAIWQKINTTITANATTAPNGTTTAERYQASASARGVIYQTITIPAQIGVVCTFSVYGKVASGTQQLRIGADQSCSYPSGAKIITLTTEWQRFDVQVTSPSTNGFFNPFIDNITDNTNACAGTAINADCFIWGAQLNIGSTAKPYFPTTDRLNVPRLTYQNGGGGCPSLLLEKQSTNYITYSEDYTNTAWVKNGVSVTGNTTTSPDGTQNADKLTSNDPSGSVYRIYETNAIPSDSVCSVSCYFKYDNWQYAFIVADNYSGVGKLAVFDLINATNTFVSSGYTATITNVGNGWYRCTMTGEMGITSYCQFGLAPTSTAYNNISIANGKNLYVWGIQREVSSYPTSYIPTTSSSATRVADACFKTGISSLIGQTEGVLFVETIYNGSANTGEYNRIINITDGTSANFMSLSKNANTDELYVYCQTSAGVQVNSGAISGTSLIGRHKIALAYKSNDFVLYVDGVQKFVDTSASVPTCSRLNIGDLQNLFSSTDQFGGSVSEAILFPTRLTNSELAQLTGNQNYTINQAYESYGVASESPNCVQP